MCYSTERARFQGEMTVCWIEVSKTRECAQYLNSEFISKVNYMKPRILVAKKLIVRLIYLLLQKNMQFHVTS